MKISDKDISFFNEKGWVIIDTNFSKKEISKYRKSLEESYKKAKEINYPLGRQYLPHLENNNIAAIEAPFNEAIINNTMKDFFKKICIGDSLSKLLGWQETYMYISRLFTMKYNYQGHWHRDVKLGKEKYRTNKFKKIQCVIYFKDQPGFRILKKEYDLNSNSKNKILKDPGVHQIQLNLPTYMYDKLPGKAGTILFFDTELLHQGYSTTERIDLFFLFGSYPNKFLRKCEKEIDKTKFIKDEFLDFYSLKEYGEKFNPFLAEDAPFLRKGSRKFRLRLVNTINYFLPLKNILNSIFYYIKNRENNHFYPNIFANTYYQKK